MELAGKLNPNTERTVCQKMTILYHQLNRATDPSEIDRLREALAEHHGTLRAHNTAIGRNSEADRHAREELKYLNARSPFAISRLFERP